jgi:hypothetical protein
VRRRIATAVSALVATGIGVAIAIATVADVEQIDRAQVLEIVRSTRYALHNACSRTPPLCVEPIPDDVVCVAVGCDEQGERERDELLRALGVRLSALPAVLAWVPPYETTDDEGIRVRMPGGWREYRVADLPRDEWRWRAEPPDVDERTPELDKWSLRVTPPPFVDPTDGGAKDERDPIVRETEVRGGQR